MPRYRTAYFVNRRVNFCHPILVSSVSSLYPRAFEISFLSWWSNPHPPAPDRGPHIRIFWVYLFKINIDFRTRAKRNVFITFTSLFSRRIISLQCG